MMPIRMANVFYNAFFQLTGVEKLNGKITYTGRVKSDLMSFFQRYKKQGVN